MIDRNQAFAAMIPEMRAIETGNPRRFVQHPSGWRFVAVAGCFGPIVLAAPPNFRLDCACHLVEGPAAQAVSDLLEVSE